jgi:hypothetical protein
MFVLFISLFSASSLLFGMKELQSFDNLTDRNDVARIGNLFRVKASKFWSMKNKFTDSLSEVEYSVRQINRPLIQVARVKLTRIDNGCIWLLNDLVFDSPSMKQEHEFWCNVNKITYESSFADVYHLIMYDFLRRTARLNLCMIVKWGEKFWYWNQEKGGVTFAKSSNINPQN